MYIYALGRAFTAYKAFLLVHAFPGKRTHDLGVGVACSTAWATGMLINASK